MFSPNNIFTTEFQFHHLYHQTLTIFVEPFPKVQYKWILNHEQQQYCQAQPKLGLALVWISPNHPGIVVKLDN